MAYAFARRAPGDTTGWSGSCQFPSGKRPIVLRNVNGIATIVGTGSGSPTHLVIYRANTPLPVPSPDCTRWRAHHGGEAGPRRWRALQGQRSDHRCRRGVDSRSGRLDCVLRHCIKSLLPERVHHRTGTAEFQRGRCAPRRCFCSPSSRPLAEDAPRRAWNDPPFGPRRSACRTCSVACRRSVRAAAEVELFTAAG